MEPKVIDIVEYTNFDVHFASIRDSLRSMSYYIE
jgi:hypothetical protein